MMYVDVLRCELPPQHSTACTSIRENQEYLEIISHRTEVFAMHDSDHFRFEEDGEPFPGLYSKITKISNAGV
jgi:hypothetical protein